MSVVCMTIFSSCTYEEEVLVIDTNKTSIELKLSYTVEGPMSRDVSPETDGSIPELDYTTPVQKALNEDDIFVLAFEKKEDNKWTLLDIVKDLQCNDNDDESYTIKGNMIQQGENKTIRFVVLTNLLQNGIVESNPELDIKQQILLYFNEMLGKTDSEIYKNLIYSLDGKWNIDQRRIPMWGISSETHLDQREVKIPNILYLYRAIAKVQIWVNRKNGFKGPDGNFFTINKIEVNNVNKQGYCVSLEAPEEEINIQYTKASIPNTATSRQNISFEDLNITTNYSDEIYLPEHIYNENDKVTLTLYYTYNGQDNEVTATFKEDIIRNHSYIFNINKLEEQNGKLYYYVEWEEEDIEVEFN